MIYCLTRPNPFAEFASLRTLQIMAERTRARAAVLNELAYLQEEVSAMETVLSDFVMLQWEKAALRLKEQRKAGKKLAAQLTKHEAREAEQRKVQAKAQARDMKEQEKLETQAKETHERAEAARKFKAIKTGVLPSHDDPEMRKQVAIALVEAKKKEREQGRRVNVFTTFMTERVFIRGQLPGLRFTPFVGVSTRLLVRFYLEERVGTNGFRIQHRAGLYRLTCFTDAKAQFASQFTSLEDIVSWLDRADFAKACQDFFGYDVIGPCIDTNALDIAAVFQTIKDEPAFTQLKLRDHGKVDCFNLTMYDITALDPRGMDRMFSCSTIQLVVWFALGKIRALAKTCEGVYAITR